MDREAVTMAVGSDPNLESATTRPSVSGRVIGRLLVDYPGSMEGFPHQVEPVVAEINGKIVIWGGQCRQNGVLVAAPPNLIHIYDVETRAWRRIQASGDIPSHSIDAAGVTSENLLYIFGGLNENFQSTNDIFSLDPSNGVFRHLPVVGDRPETQHGLQGWSHKGNLFFFASVAKGVSRKGILAAPRNLLVEFDPKTNKWQGVETTGPRPTPRWFYGAAKSENRILIHGGDGERERDVIHILDMTTKSWTNVRYGAGPDSSIKCHSLTTLSERRFFLIGGHSNGVPSNKVWSFDSDQSRWMEEEPLPPPLQLGLCSHRSVAVKRGNCLSVICVGGSDGYSTPTDKMIIFDIE